MDSPGASFSTLPAELVRAIFLQVIADDEAYFRKHSDLFEFDFLHNSRWAGNDFATSPLAHPDMSVGMPKDENFLFQRKDVKQRMGAFAAVCSLWRSVVCDFRGDLLTLAVSAQNLATFNISRDLASVTNLELVDTGPERRSFSQVRALSYILAPMASCLRFISVDPLSILWLDDILELLAGGHGQLRSLRLLRHDEEIEEDEELPTSVLDTLSRCDGLDTAAISRHTAVFDLDVLLLTLLGLPRLRTLTYTNNVSTYPVPLPPLVNLFCVAHSLERLCLSGAPHTLFDSLQIATASASTLRHLTIVSMNFDEDPEEMMLIPTPDGGYPRLEFLSLVTLLSHGSPEIAAVETDAMLSLLESAPVVSHIDLKMFSYHPPPPDSPAQGQFVERLVAKVGNGVVKMLLIESREKGFHLIPDNLRTILETDRPQSWIDSGVEVMLILELAEELEEEDAEGQLEEELEEEGAEPDADGTEDDREPAEEQEIE